MGISKATCQSVSGNEGGGGSSAKKKSGLMSRPPATLAMPRITIPSHHLARLMRPVKLNSNENSAPIRSYPSDICPSAVSPADTALAPRTSSISVSTSVIFCQIFWLRLVVSRSMSPTASTTAGSSIFSA